MKKGLLMERLPKIGVIDFGSGNIKSIINMIDKAGGCPVLLSDPADLAKADGYVLPGVGAFDFVIKRFRSGGWQSPLERIIDRGDKPILGVCVGMQMMCTSSEEGREPGLGWFRGEVKRFSQQTKQRIRVPHVGWNDITLTQSSNLFLPNSEHIQRFYFTHSYFASLENRSHVTATCEYSREFDVVIENGALMGVQFHPEKSHFFGLELFKRYVALVC